MRRYVFAIVTFALATTTAAACDLAAPVPGPGQFFVLDVESGEETTIAVEGRWLGAGCELSNPFAYDGTRFVWSEGPERSDAKQSLRLRTADGQVRTLTTSAQHFFEIGLTSEHLYYVTGTHGDPSLRRQRLSDGHDTPVDVDVPANAALNGAHVAWMTHEGKRINVYDAAAERWILRDASLASLGVQGDDQGQLFSFDAEFLVLSTYRSTQAPTTTFRYWTYEFATRDLRPAVGGADLHTSAIDAGHVFFLRFDVKEERQHLMAAPARGGDPRDLGPLPHEPVPRLVVVGDELVLGSYQSVARHEHEPHPQASGWKRTPTSTEGAWAVPAPVGGIVAAAVLGLAVALRRRHEA